MTILDFASNLFHSQTNGDRSSHSDRAIAYSGRLWTFESNFEPIGQSDRSPEDKTVFCYRSALISASELRLSYRGNPCPFLRDAHGHVRIGPQSQAIVPSTSI